MSEDITFTLFNNELVPITGGFSCTISGTGTKSCIVTVTGISPPASAVITPELDMTSFNVTIPVGTSTVKISSVADNGGTCSITSFTIPTGFRDNNLTKVSTGNSTTWGLGNGTTATLTTMKDMFLSSSILTSVPDQIPISVTNLESMFNGCIAFTGITNTNGTDTGSLNAWSTSQVTNMANMFEGCTNFNNTGVSSLWNNSTSTANVTTMLRMFYACPAFDSNIGLWNTAKVTSFSNMFVGCTNFNRDIGNWDVSLVTSYQNMFQNATKFNQQIRYWAVRSGANISGIFSNATAYIAAYNPTPPYYLATNTATPTSVLYFNQDRPSQYPCFMKGTQILCLRAEEEVYRPVQDLRKGDLVKTYRNGYLPIHMIGTSSLSNPGDDERITSRLYKCSKELYPGLFEDLYITGCHSILVPSLTDDQWENTKAILGNVYITDHHFRLMACVDEKAQPFQKDAMIDIYHIALENDDYYMNYGIYANGLLVESCSKRYLTELSNMRIIGEDEACYDTPKVNVFSELGSFVQTF